jgi:sodium--glutamate symport carrier gltS
MKRAGSGAGREKARASIIVPLVAAFFIDLVNALMIPFFLANF